MNPFGNLTTTDLEEAQDRLGGFNTLETDAYTGTVKVAYAGKSAGGAQSVTVILDLGNTEYSETFYVTNKAGENFFRNKQDNNKKIPLPGFTMVNDLCLVTTNKQLSDQSVEEKMVNIYDFDLKKAVPKAVPVLVELIGHQVTFGILKTLENKSVKDGAGEYQPTAETREVNVTDKIFHYPSNITVAEATHGGTEATFHAAWLAKNKGVTRDKRTIKEGQPGAVKSGKPGSPPQAGAQQAKTPSLFGNK